jgi:HlyD family secretion protein
MQQKFGGQLFRPQALNKVFAADDLDKTMQVTRPTGWLALLVIGVVIAAAFTWSLTSTLSIKIGANGVILDDGHGRQQAALFVLLAKEKSVRPGMKVLMTPAGFSPQQYGYLLGTVRSAGQYPLTSQTMAEILKNDALEAVFKQDGPTILVTVELQRNAAATGHAWTGRRDLSISSGTLVQANIVVDEKRPIELLLPGTRE